MLSCGGGGHHSGCLDESGRHLWRHPGGSGRTYYTGHITYQPHTAINPDVLVALHSHVQNPQAVVVEAGQLALERPAAIATTNGNDCLRVENGQLPPWEEHPSVRKRKDDCFHEKYINTSTQ